MDCNDKYQNLIALDGRERVVTSQLLCFELMLKIETSKRSSPCPICSQAPHTTYTERVSGQPMGSRLAVLQQETVEKGVAPLSVSVSC